MIKLSREWTGKLIKEPETGMGYHIVTVILKDGRRYDQVVINSGYVTRVRNFSAIPFAEDEIAEIAVTHDKWDFNQDGRR